MILFRRTASTTLQARILVTSEGGLALGDDHDSIIAGTLRCNALYVSNLCMPFFAEVLDINRCSENEEVQLFYRLKT
jgi:hypothetical protein